jgi:hypothetical protein
MWQICLIGFKRHNKTKVKTLEVLLKPNQGHNFQEIPVQRVLMFFLIAFVLSRRLHDLAAFIPMPSFRSCLANIHIMHAPENAIVYASSRFATQPSMGDTRQHLRRIQTSRLYLVSFRSGKRRLCSPRFSNGQSSQADPANALSKTLCTIIVKWRGTLGGSLTSRL